MLRYSKERSQLGNFQNELNKVLDCWYTRNLSCLKKRKCNNPKCVVDKRGAKGQFHKANWMRIHLSYTKSIKEKKSC